MANQSPPPTVAPPAYSTHEGPGNPPLYAPPQGVPGYYPPQGYPQQGYAQQQQQQVTVITAVPIQTQEVWRSPRGDILPQPDPNRVVIGGTARYRYGMLMSTSYTYADQLPCLTSTMLVFIVLCFFIGTPVSLMCSIPAYYFINKVYIHTHTHVHVHAHVYMHTHMYFHMYIWIGCLGRIDSWDYLYVYWTQ